MAANKMIGMKALAISLILIGYGVPAQGAAPRPAAGTGGVTGKVSFQGTKPKLPQISMAQDRVCASEQKSTVYPEDGRVNSNGTLPNVFIYVKQGLGDATFKTPSTPVTLDQQRCEYQPHVLGIMVGQPLQVLSQDPTTHNIHIMAKNNRSWNVSQQPGSPAFIRRFLHPEIMIPVKCNQHPWMKAYIGVTTNPFYAVTGKDGTFILKGLPSGHYTLEAWTATFGTQESEVTVEADKTATVNFTFHSQ